MNRRELARRKTKKEAMIYRTVKVKNLLENTEGGQFFVKGGELFLAGEDMDMKMRVRDGKIFSFSCDDVEVRSVSGKKLHRELARAVKERNDLQP